MMYAFYNCIKYVYTHIQPYMKKYIIINGKPVMPLCTIYIVHVYKLDLILL